MARRQRWARQAALQTLLRFGPEESGLEELQRQAHENFDSAVRTADSTALGTIGAINQAIPEVEGIYDRAGLDQARTGETLIGRDLAGLGSVADSIKAGAALEAANALGNLQQARAGALTDLRQQRVSARAGAGFAKQSAQEQLVSNLTGLLERKQGLRREKGAFTALTVEQLEDAARKEARDMERLTMQLGQQERNSIRSSGTDPDTGLPTQNAMTAASRERRQARPKLSPEKHLDAQSKVDMAMEWLRRLDPGKADRREVAPLLVTGVKEPARGGEQVYDPNTGKRVLNKDGTPRKVGGRQAREVPGVGGLFASVAADVFYDAHLSRRNEKRLRRAGFSLAQLGLPTYEQWRRSGGPARQKRQRAKQVTKQAIGGLPDFSLKPVG